MTHERTHEPAAMGLLAGDRDLAPEERLMIEVLACACNDLRLSAHGPAADALRGEARRWIEGEDESWSLSFVPICRHFGVDPQALRARLLRADRHGGSPRLPQAA
ncbi:hypothetical protein KF840_05040 [bacterium]|nr:hypothetical protein [bacterium]